MTTLAKLGLFAATHRGLLIKLGLGLVAAALVAWGFYALVVQPRSELRDAQEQLSIASADRGQAQAALKAAQTQAMMTDVLSQAQSDVADAAAAGRQAVADQAAAREVQTNTIQTRIVERVVKNGDGNASDNMDSFLDDLGEIK